MIPLGFLQIFIIAKINNIWVYPHTLHILLNQAAIFELKACAQRNANPTFQRHLPPRMGSISVPVTVLHSSNCHGLLWNPQYVPVASVFLDYCSLWSAFCVPLDMGQILTWGAESYTMCILYMSQRNFLFPCTWASPWQSLPHFPDRQGKENHLKHIKELKSSSWAAQNNSFNYYDEMS